MTDGKLDAVVLPRPTAVKSIKPIPLANNIPGFQFSWTRNYAEMSGKSYYIKAK